MNPNDLRIDREMDLLQTEWTKVYSVQSWSSAWSRLTVRKLMVLHCGLFSPSIKAQGTEPHFKVLTILSTWVYARPWLRLSAQFTESP
jgi:hypothetical protein